MDNELDPAAQGTEAAPENAGQQTQEPEAVQTVPLARVNELTAKLRETERQAAEQAAQRERQLADQQAQIAALMQIAAARANDSLPTPPPVPELEPEFRRALEAREEPIKRQLAQQAAMFQQFMAQQEFQQASAGYEADVVANAQKLYQTWQQNGYSGWKPKDALTFAQGQKLDAQRQSAQDANAQSSQYNQLQSTVQRAQGNTAPAPSQAKGKGLPANFDQLPGAVQGNALDDMDDFPIF